MTDKIAIIGFGNIAKAIITPLLEKKLIQPEDVFCVVKSKKSFENNTAPEPAWGDSKLSAYSWLICDW